MIRVMPISELPITPSMGSLIGTAATTSVLDEINSAYNTQGGVIFGQQGDPYADRYNALKSKIVNELRISENIIREVYTDLENPYKIRPITTEEGLRFTPISMQLPIIMHEPVRKLFIQGRLQGYGFDKEFLPEEDVFGRLINNGSADLSSYARENKLDTDEFTWEWKMSDPDLSYEELDNIEVTRAFITKWLEQELSEDGSMRDPTDPSCKIGRAKAKK